MAEKKSVRVDQSQRLKRGKKKNNKNYHGVQQRFQDGRRSRKEGIL